MISLVISLLFSKIIGLKLAFIIYVLYHKLDNLFFCSFKPTFFRSIMYLMFVCLFTVIYSVKSLSSSLYYIYHLWRFQVSQHFLRQIICLINQSNIWCLFHLNSTTIYWVPILADCCARDSFANRFFPLLALMKQAAILGADLWRGPHGKELSATSGLKPAENGSQYENL